MPSAKQLAEILEKAQERLQSLNQGYKGALTPQETFAVIKLATNARLVDVRTRAEWEWVGRVPDAVEIEWKQSHNMETNPDFLVDLQKQVPKNAVLLFICRSGARSAQAAKAATMIGYGDCYNVLEGFEGDLDQAGHRGTINGWKVAGLPWKQS